MLKTLLTAEESAKLIELGVSPEGASERTPDYTDINNTGRPLERRDLLPVFTLTDILDILPKENDGSPLGMEYDCEFKQWWVGYNLISLEFAPELIDALYSLLVWYMEKGCVK